MLDTSRQTPCDGSSTEKWVSMPADKTGIEKMQARKNPQENIPSKKFAFKQHIYNERRQHNEKKLENAIENIEMVEKTSKTTKNALDQPSCSEFCTGQRTTMSVFRFVAPSAPSSLEIAAAQPLPLCSLVLESRQRSTSTLEHVCCQTVKALR